MDINETTTFCRVVRALKPAQHWDAHTPATWSLVLSDVTLADAQRAAVALAKEQQWIAPDDVLRWLKAERKTRLEHVNTVTPNVDPDDPQAFRREFEAVIARVADGTLDVAAYEDGGWTLTGAEPARPRGSAQVEARPGRVKAIAATVERSMPRPPTSGPEFRSGARPARRELSPGESRAAEAERQRQLSALSEERRRIAAISEQVGESA